MTQPIAVIQTSVIGSCNWASEASPTLGCSIEISRDILVDLFVLVCQSA